MYDCPKCVTVCKQPHCVTHCQAPKPECEAVCEEPKCDWKCVKPQCPKPKCELVCENPNCVPKVSCCSCNGGAAPVALGFPFFKETETNKACCGCDGKGKGIVSENQNVNNVNVGDIGTMGSSTIYNDGQSVGTVNTTRSVEFLKKPQLLTGRAVTGSISNNPYFDRDRESINIDLANK